MVQPSNQSKDQSENRKTGDSEPLKEWLESASKATAERNVLTALRKLVKEVLHAKYGPSWRDHDRTDAFDRTGEATEDESAILEQVLTASDGPPESPEGLARVAEAASREARASESSRARSERGGQGQTERQPTGDQSAEKRPNAEPPAVGQPIEPVKPVGPVTGQDAEGQGNPERA